ncbi:hypothetical protein ES703_89816 [subsurface metagenome]
MQYDFGQSLRDYKQKCEKLYSKDGFTISIAQRILPIAMLRASDVYHLFCYAKNIPNGGTYLEIGSWIGGSLVCAYEATRIINRTVHFIAVEPIFRKGFLNNVKLIPNFRLIKATSDSAVDQIKDDSVDLLFLDGDHSHEQVKRDLTNYWPKIKMGGILLGHDYVEEKAWEVKPAADELFGRKLQKFSDDSRLFFINKQRKEDLNGAWSYADGDIQKR